MAKRIRNFFFKKVLIKIFSEVSTSSCSNKIASTITIFDALDHYKK